MKLTALAVALVVGCGSAPRTQSPPPGRVDPAATSASPAPAPPPLRPLFERLGGLTAITAVVDDFVNRAATDARIRDRFFNADAVQLKKLLVELVCKASGGSCAYTGRDMTITHAGMDLVDDEFTALVEDLIATLDKLGVAPQEKAELLGAIGPLKPQIVVEAGKLHPIEGKQLEAVAQLAATLNDQGAKELLAMAVTAGRRGQRSYAEQLFTRAELIVGAKPIASAAATFRAGAPTRITTPLKKLEDPEADQFIVKKSGDLDDEPRSTVRAGSLKGTLKIGGKKPAGLGVVTLTPLKGAKKRSAKRRVIEQRGREFVPHVMAVPVGSTVSFPNWDPIFHNVFSLAKSTAFDLGLYKNGDSREVKFDKPGIVRLGCNLHATMSGYLIVVEAPHYVVVLESGAFSFAALAPGKYKLEAWNEGAGDPATSEIVIKEGANEQALDLAAVAAGVPPDKFGRPRE